MRVVFTLDAHGGLIGAEAGNASSAPDQTLYDIALTSLREAGPFPVFPKALSLPRMSFDVVISFRRK